MIRIAMLGCDSSHTEAYSELLHKSDSVFFGKARIEWLWGEDAQQAEKKAKDCGIKNVIASLEDSDFEKADLIMVCGRYGNSHALPARRAIATGKPVYIDKPFTNNYSEAIELAEMARTYNTAIASFSPLRFSPEIIAVKTSLEADFSYAAVVSGPARTNFIKDERAKKIHFYGIHAVDILCSFFSDEIVKITANKTEKGIWTSIEYKSGRHATLNLPFINEEFYHFSLYTNTGVFSQSIDPYGAFYIETMKVLLSDLVQEDCSRFPIHEACEAIKILDEIEKLTHLQKANLVHEKI